MIARLEMWHVVVGARALHQRLGECGVVCRLCGLLSAHTTWQLKGYERRTKRNRQKNRRFTVTAPTTHVARSRAGRTPSSGSTAAYLYTTL